MPRIFLCHASEDKPIAEPIQLALAGAGHEVFYDEQSLPPGGDYHERIHSAIKDCDLFVFIASPNSVAPGRFTLSELGFARARWPTPVGRVLPVVVGELRPRDLPAYLKAATVLEPTGNVATEVRQAVRSLLESATRARRDAMLRLAGICGLLLSATVAGWIWLAWRSQPPVTPPNGVVIPAERDMPDHSVRGEQGAGAVGDGTSVAGQPGGDEAAPQPCRHESHGIESYARDFVVERVSPWMGGGYSRDRWCDDVIATLKGEYSTSVLKVTGTDESSKNTCPPFNCPQYQYVCKVRVRAEPVYNLRESAACT